jgi:hypothetical protein
LVVDVGSCFWREVSRGEGRGETGEGRRGERVEERMEGEEATY